MTPIKIPEARESETWPTVGVERSGGGSAPRAGGSEAAHEPPPPARFVPLGEYVASPKGSPDALLGDGDDVLLPVGGLLMAYGDAGAGKTTFDVDAVAHLASGTDWVGISVARPVSVALIQNEGPAEPWRRKLERKLAGWTGEPWRDNVLVLDEPHGGFDFRIPEHRASIRELRAKGAELVVADPTKWLGMEGGGTPAEVREFVTLLKDCGLHSGDPDAALAFWLAHHENVRGEISGAWRADPDTVVHVEADGQGRTKATWEKCRWSSGRHGQKTLLAWTEGEGFEPILLQEGPQISDEELDEQVLAWLVDNPGKHPTTQVRGAITARNERVDTALLRLRERGECADFDRKGAPHSGASGTPRYWIASVHAGSEVAPALGASPGDIENQPLTGPEVAPSPRHKEGRPPGGASPGRGEETPDEEDIERWEGMAGDGRNGAVAEPEPVAVPQHRTAVELLEEQYAAEDATGTDLGRNAGEK